MVIPTPGTPLACAAGLAALDVYEKEDLLTRGASLAAPFAKMVHSLAGEPHVVDVRNLGLMAAIELEARPDAPGARGYDVLLEALARGLLVRLTGDTIALSPPLIIAPEHLARIHDTLQQVLRTVK